MARNTITLTNAWQQLATVSAVIRVISSRPGAVVLFNESATDLDAFSDNVQPDDQYSQNESKPTFARVSSGGDVTVFVDEEG